MISKYMIRDEEYDEKLIWTQKLTRFDIITDKILMINGDIITEGYRIETDISDNNAMTIKTWYTRTAIWSDGTTFIIPWCNVSYTIKGLSSEQIHKMLYPYGLKDMKVFHFIMSNNGDRAMYGIKKVNGILTEAWHLNDESTELHQWYDNYCNKMILGVR
jgi:hypothetical protein